jgi:hypothetical protein
MMGQLVYLAAQEQVDEIERIAARAPREERRTRPGLSRALRRLSRRG